MSEGISERELSLIVKNEEKWREFLIRKIEKIEKDQSDMVVTVTTLKIKIGLISGGFGALTGLIAGLVTKKLGG